MVEVVIGAFIVSAVMLGAYGAFTTVIKTVKASRIKTDAMMFANEQIEIVRNMPYADVGVVEGIPPGKIPKVRSFTRDGINFTLTTSVKNVDDPFDGVMGSTTNNDLAPADYKLVQFDLSCNCNPGIFSGASIVTTVSAKGLEMSNGNGALFINAFNANGDPVPGALVQVAAVVGTTTVNVSETTNLSGQLQLVDVPPGALIYRITVSKTGYSTDGTTNASPANPNPLLPPVTVEAGKTTNVSYSIDRTASLRIVTEDAQCAALSGVPVRLQGSKLIGQSPNVYKYDQTPTSAGGQISLNLEWDSYKYIFATSSAYYLAGSLPLLPMALSPGATQDIRMVFVPASAKGLLVTVKDAVTDLPLGGSIIVGGQTKTSGQGFFAQTDWSGGSGQTNFNSNTRFAETDGNIEYSAAPGELSLRSSFGQYAESGYLVSSVFDTGATTTVYSAISWTPADQATSTGPGAVKLQIATSEDPATSTWTFRGPDGTAGSFYTVANSSVSPVHDGGRYVRYKLYLSTASSTLTPNISSISLTLGGGCLPPGQAYFDGLSGETQTVSVTKTGYSPYSGTAVTDSAWQQFTVLMQPQ